METENYVIYEGIAVGGPLDGETVQSRFPKGFLYADPVGGRAWVYDYAEGGTSGTSGLEQPSTFTAREVADLDREKAMKAAEGDTYDVRAYDDGELPDDLEVGL